MHGFQFEAYMMVGHHTLVTIESLDDTSNIYRVVSYIGADDFSTPQSVLSDSNLEITAMVQFENRFDATKYFMDVCGEEIDGELNEVRLNAYA